MPTSASRHAILYDVVRWRGNRTLLLLPATAFLLTPFFTALLRPSSGGGGLFPAVGGILYAMSAMLWLRQRFSYLVVDGDSLLIRVMTSRRRVPLVDVRRARVVRLRSVFGRPERQRMLPGRPGRWLDEEAVALRLDQDVADLVALRRLLGARCVIESELVLPVTDPQSLIADIERGRPAPERVHTPGRGARRRRR